MGGGSMGFCRLCTAFITKGVVRLIRVAASGTDTFKSIPALLVKFGSHTILMKEFEVFFRCPFLARFLAVFL